MLVSLLSLCLTKSGSSITSTFSIIPSNVYSYFLFSFHSFCACSNFSSSIKNGIFQINKTTRIQINGSKAKGIINNNSNKFFHLLNIGGNPQTPGKQGI